MAKSIKTLGEILEFQRLAIMRLEKERNTKTISALSTNLQDMIGEFMVMGGYDGKLTSIILEYRKEYKKMQRTLCSKDASNNLIIDAHGRYSFTAENEEKLEAWHDEKIKTKHEIEPSYCSSENLPKDLHYAEKEIYPGFVIYAGHVVKQ